MEVKVIAELVGDDIEVSLKCNTAQALTLATATVCAIAQRAQIDVNYVLDLVKEAVEATQIKPKVESVQ